MLFRQRQNLKPVIGVASVIIAFSVFCWVYFPSETGEYSSGSVPSPGGWKSSNDVIRHKERDATKLYPWLVKRNYLPNFFTRPTNKMTSERAPPDAAYANSTLVFVHNLKSGGQTTKNCLSEILEQIGESNFLLVGDPTANVFYNQMLVDGTDQKLAKAYAGASAFAVCDFTTKPCGAFTVLRHPYERLISSYNMCIKIKQAHCRMRPAEKMTVNEWALHQGSFFFRQLILNPDFFTPDYSELLAEARTPEDPPIEKIPPWWRQKLLLDQVMREEHKELVLDYVLDNLESWFAVIGLTTEYDMNFRLLERAFQLPFHTMCVGKHANQRHYEEEGEGANITKEEVVEMLKIELSSDRAVREALHYDIEIYRRAEDIFRRQKIAFEDDQL